MLLRGKLFRKKLKWLIILLGNVKIFSYQRKNMMSFDAQSKPIVKAAPAKDEDELVMDIKSEDY